MSLLIRPALAGEAAELQALVRAAPGDRLPELSAEYLERTPVCAAWEGTRLAGCYALEQRAGEWWLAHLWVAEGCAGRGRGRWLLTDAVRRARRQGVELLRLAPRADAQGFFTRMGGQWVTPGEMAIDVATWLEPLPESVSELGWSS